MSVTTVAPVSDDPITSSIQPSKLGPTVKITSASAIDATVDGSGSNVCASPSAGTIDVTSTWSPPTCFAQSARMENEATTFSASPSCAAAAGELRTNVAGATAEAAINVVNERRESVMESDTFLEEP